MMKLGCVVLLSAAGLVVGLVGCASEGGSSSMASGAAAAHVALFDGPAMPAASGTRTIDGRPGPDYWQQQADYVIEADIDPAARRVVANAMLTYTNNSPMDLGFIWFDLPLHAFREDSRSAAIRHVNTRFRALGDEFGHRKLTFSVGGEELEPLMTDTRARIDLPEAVAADGGQVLIEMSWEFEVPEGSNRMGVLEFEDDELFEIARWIPQPCVYDDVYGWNTLPYLGAGESYSNFGNYDVTVRAPEGVLVAGGGEWLNPGERLTAEQFAAYERAGTSDETVWIVGPSEADGEGAIDDEAGDAVEDGVDEAAERAMVAWRYRAENVRTFAFVAGDGYLMDGASVEIDGARVRLLSVYPEGVSRLWNDISTRAMAHAIEFYGDFLGLEYPYPVLVNCFGVEGGTEYPMMIYCGSREPREAKAEDYADNPDVADAAARAEEVNEQRWERARSGLFSVTDHEALHQWFPMVVGNDERRDGWLDEGFDEYGNPYSAAAWFAKEDGDDGDGSDAEEGAAEFDAERAIRDVRNISRFAFRRDVPSILTDADKSQAFGARGLNVYSKPGAGLIALREGILGAERFDVAMAGYLNAWAFKHPRPSDFFRYMENAAGEDLGYWWRGWFGSTEQVDVAVNGFEFVVPTRRGEPYWAIKLELVGAIPVPISVRVEWIEGDLESFAVPVEAWFGGRTFELRVPTEAREGMPVRTLHEVLVDPARVLPDSERSNNAWPRRGD